MSIRDEKESARASSRSPAGICSETSKAKSRSCGETFDGPRSSGCGVDSMASNAGSARLISRLVTTVASAFPDTEMLPMATGLGLGAEATSWSISDDGVCTVRSTNSSSIARVDWAFWSGEVVAFVSSTSATIVAPGSVGTESRAESRSIELGGGTGGVMERSASARSSSKPTNGSPMLGGSGGGVSGRIAIVVSLSGTFGIFGGLSCATDSPSASPPPRVSSSSVAPSPGEPKRWASSVSIIGAC